MISAWFVKDVVVREKNNVCHDDPRSCVPNPAQLNNVDAPCPGREYLGSPTTCPSKGHRARHALKAEGSEQHRLPSMSLT